MNTARTRWTALLAGSSLATLAFWLASSASPRAALAQVPDSGLQRQQMIEELRTANRKLDEIATLLREIRDSRPPDEKRNAPTTRPARPQP